MSQLSTKGRKVKPLTKPKGWRAITVEGRVWYWTIDRGGDVVARSADRQDKRATTVAHISEHVPNCPEMVQRGSPEEGFHDVPVLMPRHVAAWLKDGDSWVSAL